MLAIFLWVIAFCSTTPSAYADLKISDINGHWAQVNIQKLVDAQVVAGNPDGTFEPDKNISRAEFSVMVVKAFKVQQQSGKVFSDTADHWAKDYIATANANGILSGYGNDKFGPDDPITREQMANIIVKAAKLQMVTSGLTFVDSSQVSSWAKDSVATAYANKIISGYNNYFKPLDKATKAEAAVIINAGMAAAGTEVVPPATVEALTGVSLNKTTISLAVGSKETLVATVAPANAADKAVTWTSADTKIATVDNAGVVTAVAKGTTTITATTANGKSASCNITVTSASGGGGGGVGANHFTVNFNLNYDGAPNTLPSQSIVSGQFAQRPANPVREGYAFVGWYTTSGCSELFLFEDAINSNKTLYAGWLAVDENIAKIDNAINQLKIGFAPGDYANSVTQNITLPTSTGDGVTVEWSSSDSSYITNNGTVVRPQSESVIVTLTAKVSCGDKYENRTFDLKVIKLNQPDPSTINDNDLDDLTVLNNGQAPEIAFNDNHDISSIDGCYSDIVVESPEEAILSLYSIKTLMKMNDPHNEFVYNNTNSDEYGNTFCLKQVYNGIPVYGREVMVSTDTAGNITSLNSGYLPSVLINTTPTVSVEDAYSAAKNYIGGSVTASDGSLVIYSLFGTNPVLAWSIQVEGTDNTNNYVSSTVLVNAESAIPIIDFSNIQTGNVVSSGKDLLGNTRTFNTKFSWLSMLFFEMRDTIRNISTYDNSWRPLPAVIYSSEFNWWTDKASVSAHANVETAYDFFKNLGRYSWDNEGSSTDIYVHGFTDNASSSTNSSRTVLRFGDAGSRYKLNAAAALDVAGHEYTHSVVASMTALDSNYNNAPGAINEGYADLFGYLIENKNDPEWLHGEDIYNRRAGRNMSNPEEFEQPISVGGRYYQEPTNNPNSTNDNGGVHKNNSIISHAAYLMWNQGISDKTRLAKLWYGSLRKGYDATAEYINVRRNVLKAAREQHFSANEIQIIKNAFDEVNIIETVGNIVIRGKITIADEDMDMTNNLPLATAAVKVAGVDSPLIKTASTNEQGEYTIQGLTPGAYLITISKTGYMSLTQFITIREDQTNYYNATIESISETYSGNGQASGTIYDVLTGVGVPDLTLKIRSGLNNVSEGDVVASISTGSNGAYITPSLPAGLYCIEIIDQRAISDESQRYLNNFTNIKILGGKTVPSQNGTVSTALATDQIRIILRWGLTPSDLDSHLVGPNNSGGKFHVFYPSNSRTYNENGTKIADLDLDDVTSYGPETVTVYKPNIGKYTYYVHDYTNRGSTSSTALANSGAYIQVFKGTSNSAIYTFNVPNAQGTLWKVFEYDSATSAVTPINTMLYESDPGYVGSRMMSLRSSEIVESLTTDDLDLIINDILQNPKPIEEPPTTYTVTYDGNGNTGGITPDDSNGPYAANTTVTVLDNTGNLIQTGCTFAGWNTEPNGSGTSYEANATFTITADTILYAQWITVPGDA